MSHGKACGKGAFTWTVGSKFFGTWDCRNNSRSGVLCNSDGRMMMVGAWVNEAREGYGCNINGKEVVVGLWSNGNLVNGKR